MNSDRVLLMGNEAIARGALEGNVAYCTGYPGNPSSEIVDSIFPYKERYGVEVEWSVNEMVALEAAAAFSFSGLRAMATMKQLGVNVCSDFLTTVCLSELAGGLLLVVCDDPGPLTSANEEDSRHFAKIAQIPLLEPSTPQEAKDMTKWLLEFSEQMGVICMLRCVSRLSHGRGGVRLGPVPQQKTQPFFDVQKSLVGLPRVVTVNHESLLKKMRRVQGVFDESEFNSYHGPPQAQFLILATGLGVLYAMEAVDTLGLSSKVGILKIGTTWPLPARLISKHLNHAARVLFVEEIDPFLEDQVKVLYAESRDDLGKIEFFGKNTGEIRGPHGPGVGEINTDIVMAALQDIFKINKSGSDSYERLAEDLTSKMLVPRELSFCQGCPHRASFFALNAALALDGRNGFVVGDIGCYGLAAGATGFNQIKVLHCMGSGMGNASGFSKLTSFGFDQPVVAVAGDSTFYHACLPALVNAKSNNADTLLAILDNGITAMTGFQVSPSSSIELEGITPVPVEDICRGIGIETTVLDPVEDVQKAIETIYYSLQEKGVKVIVFRRLCATYEQKRVSEKQWQTAWVDQDKCVGEDCGCDRFCSRVLGCPAIEFDRDKRKAYINEDICNACGLCVQLCPREAILLVERKNKARR
ncbi:MAG: thiamine pyrophosphate-dependent enzyme [Dehalococcoidia bacterium]